MFVLTRTLKLDKFEGWEGCYVTFNSCTIKDLTEAGLDTGDAPMEKLKKQDEFLTKFFVKGLGWNGKEKVEIKAKDIAELPMQIYTECLNFLVDMSQIRNTTAN